MDTNKKRVGGNRLMDGFGINKPLRINRHSAGGETVLFQEGDRTIDGRMFNRGEYDVIAATVWSPGDSLDSEVGGFRAAGGKEDGVGRFGVDEVSDLRPGLSDGVA